MPNYLKFKDLSKRKVLGKNYINFFLLKTLLQNSETTQHLKFKIMLSLQKSKKKCSTSQLNSRCIYSNFSRGIQRLNSISKSEFKKKFSEGKITGFRKAS